MPTTWETCDDKTERMIKKMMREHHPKLVEAEVTFKALFAQAGDDEPPPLKLNGYPCAAIVKKTSARDRVGGKADFEIAIDAVQWADLTDESKLALVDHELEHVEVMRKPESKGGGIIYDCAGRPKLGLKLHDWQIGGFATIAKRHGEHALEVIAARNFQDNYGQYVFGFAMTNA